ncbi:hypothetical protein [Sphingobium sp.]|uniref:hypothetical protein n=1 Tax=Sphingobium sp. TaxID=1912891 RepID=UPI002B6B0155|nr:hypothetical protein [Sphingobium sp.]HUD92229.1 hypothetical protein [Sphingobium sp.]
MEKRQEDGETVVHLSKEEARSGSRTPVTRSILYVSLALTIIVLAVVLSLGYFRTDRSGADQVNADNGTERAQP